LVVVEANKTRRIGDQTTASAFPEEFCEAYGDVEALKKNQSFNRAKAFQASDTRAYLTEHYRNFSGTDRIFSLLMDGEDPHRAS
jgi:hypothetical protein